MKVIDSRTVELTDSEVKASDFFNGLLDSGQGIVEAATETQKKFPVLDPAFFDWLVR